MDGMATYGTTALDAPSQSGESQNAATYKAVLKPFAALFFAASVIASLGTMTNEKAERPDYSALSFEELRSLHESGCARTTGLAVAVGRLRF